MSSAPLTRARGDRLPAHLVVDDAGMDGVDADAVALARELEGHRFREQGDAALGERIERRQRRADEADDRRQVDDGPALRTCGGPRAQRRQRRLGAENDTRQVDRAEPLPVLGRRFLDPLADEDAGIVDEDVDAAEARHRGGDGRCPVVRPRHVEMHIERVAARRLEPAHRRAPALVQDIADHDARPRLHHQPRRLRPDAARRPGQERDLAVESVHGVDAPKAATDSPTFLPKRTELSDSV